MNTFLPLLTAACVCGFVPALAGDSPPIGTQSTKPAPTTALPSKSVAGKPAPIVLEDKTLTNDEVRQLLSRGYKPVGRGGEVYYCRREEKTGSRFTTMSCKTADEMKQLTREGKDMLAAKQKSGGCMTNGPGC